MKISKDVKIAKEVKIAMEVKIVKEVKRSNGSWRFACGDVSNWDQHGNYASDLEDKTESKSFIGFWTISYYIIYISLIGKS